MLGTPFAIPVDGDSPSTDQLIVVSGDASSARLFEEISATGFRATKRLRLRPAPGGGGRVLVFPIDRLVIPDDGATSQRTLRLLPVDLFGNVADPGGGGIQIALQATGGVAIVSPDGDADTTTETVTLATASGVDLTLDDPGTAGSGALLVSSGGTAQHSVEVAFGAAIDSDGDGVGDDGDGSGIVGDRYCTDTDVQASTPCDDNCALVANASQFDDDVDGVGNCCDGTCAADPLSDGCNECAQPGQGGSVGFERVRVKLKIGSEDKPDKLGINLRFNLAPGATIQPDEETVTLEIVHNDVTQYTADLDRLFVDLQKSKPKFRYFDPDANVDGVRKALIANRKSNEYKSVWKASDLGLLTLGAGAARINLTIGNDTVSADLVCDSNGRRVRCELP